MELIEIDYTNYSVILKREDGTIIKIYENEEGIIYQNLYLGQSVYLDNSQYINIPQFEGYEQKTQLKILFNEIMINITNEGPKPNFIAYDNAWYRDAAIIAMVLEKTNNIKQIEDWIKGINQIYDKQNGIEETDNIGQVYIQEKQELIFLKNYIQYQMNLVRKRQIFIDIIKHLI